MSESPQPTFAIEKIYLKDLSVEVPNAPEVFLEREAPTVDVNIGSKARAVQDGRNFRSFPGTQYRNRIGWCNEVKYCPEQPASASSGLA